MKQEWKTVKMVIVITGMFFILWLPYFVFFAIKSYKPHMISNYIERLVFCCVYSNTCNNWIVYSVMNKKLRLAFKKCLRQRTRASRRVSFATKTCEFNRTVQRPISVC